jgi:hypothetical protein
VAAGAQQHAVSGAGHLVLALQARVEMDAARWLAASPAIHERAASAAVADDHLTAHTLPVGRRAAVGSLLGVTRGVGGGHRLLRRGWARVNGDHPT